MNLVSFPCFLVSWACTWALLSTTNPYTLTWAFSSSPLLYSHTHEFSFASTSTTCKFLSSPRSDNLHLSTSTRSTSLPATFPSRRDFCNAAMIGTSSVAYLGLNPLQAQAKTLPQVDKDKANLVKGYIRLTYLLENWERLTTDCVKDKSEFYGCARTPEVIMEYIGYKSMDDPLYRADKMLIRLQEKEVYSDKDEAAFEDAAETYRENSEIASGTAFISSWGEANPGGGKDRIVFFLEKSKKNVVACRDSLETVIRILNLKV